MGLISVPVYVFLRLAASAVEKCTQILPNANHTPTGSNPEVGRAGYRIEIGDGYGNEGSRAGMRIIRRSY